MITRKFKHHSGKTTLAGGIVKVTTVPYPHGTDKSKFFLSNNCYWETETNCDAVNSVKVGDEFKIIGYDNVFVTVEQLNAPDDSVQVKISTIQAAAKKSKAAHDLLVKIIPEAFPKPKVKPDWTQSQPGIDTIMTSDGTVILERRASGEFTDHIWLNVKFDWTIEKDGTALVLVAKEK